jgi:hypothetical protein
VRCVVSGADLNRRPEIRKMKGGVPYACAAHRKAPKRHPFRIDLVSFLRELHRLEDIGLSRPVIGILAAAE